MGFGMMKELLNGGVWNKTSQLIQDKYGKKIEFRFLSMIESEQPFYSTGDDLVVPLKSRHKYLGDVVIQRGATMTVDEKMELTDLIQFLIEPQAYNLHLKSVENSLAYKPQFEHVVDTNVISIFGKIDSAENALDFNEDSEKRKTISNILHLKSKSALLRHKVASQIHEISGSPFFIRIQDISKSIHSVSDLKNLAGSTIFIENILQLTSSEIEIVADFAKDNQGIELQFLIGSDLTDKEIASLPCHEQLKNDLLGFLFDIDRVPASQQTQAEVLELLFFSLDQSIS